MEKALTMDPEQTKEAEIFKDVDQVHEEEGLEIVKVGIRSQIP